MAIDQGGREYVRDFARNDGAINDEVLPPWLRPRLHGPVQARAGESVTLVWRVPLGEGAVEFFDGAQWQRVLRHGRRRLLMPIGDLVTELRVDRQVVCRHVVALLRQPAAITANTERQDIPFGADAVFKVEARDALVAQVRESGGAWQPMPFRAEIVLGGVVAERRLEVAARGTDGVLRSLLLVAMPSLPPAVHGAEAERLIARWTDT